MTGCPIELSAGDRFGATIWNGLIRYVRSLRLIQGPGVKLTRTPNGTIVSVKPAKTAAAGSVARNGLFEIEKIVDTGRYHEDNPDDDSPGPFVVWMKNCHYSIAGRLFTLEQEVATGEEAGEDQAAGEIHSQETDFPCLLALSIDAGEEEEEERDVESDTVTATLEVIGGIEALRIKQRSRDKYVIPLYQFGANGEVLIDFRSGPIAVMWEKGI